MLLVDALGVHLCTKCGLVQSVKSGDKLPTFRDTQGLANCVLEHERLAAGANVVALGLQQNVLAYFAEAGMTTRGLTAFDEDIGYANMSTARAVICVDDLARADDLQGYLRGASFLLEPGGIFVAEVPYLWSIVDMDLLQVMHQGYRSYFGLGAIYEHSYRFGLRIFHAELVDSYLRLWAIKPRRIISGAIVRIMWEEGRRHVTDPGSYASFVERVNANGTVTRSSDDLPSAGTKTRNSKKVNVQSRPAVRNSSNG